MASSGYTALETTGNTPVQALPGGFNYRTVIIVNTGANTGFYSLDGGNTYNYLTAQVNSVPGGVFIPGLNVTEAILIQEEPDSGAHLSGIFVSAF